MIKHLKDLVSKADLVAGLAVVEFLVINMLVGQFLINHPLFFLVWVYLGAAIACYVIRETCDFCEVLDVVLYAAILVFQYVLVFAFYYQLHGVIDSDKVIHKSLGTCIYFSLVTWTTLGYGDFLPTKEIRIVAGAEALLGYILMGAFLAFCLNMNQTSESKAQD